MLSKLIAALQNADLDMQAEEIADTVWLALQMGFQQVEVDIQQNTHSSHSHIQEDLPSDQQFPSLLPTPSTTEIAAHVHLHALHSHDDNRSSVASVPFRSPAASALPNALALARALRPLMRRIPSRTAVVFNEHATVQKIAETQTNLWIPVFDPAPVRWFDVELVIDVGASMLLWQQTIVELRVLLEHLGAFRDVRLWRLDTDKEDRIALYAGISSAQELAQARNPKELINPGASRLILVVSDCVSLAWHSGKVRELLDVWGQKNMVTLIHMLPRRLWPQTILEHADIVQIYSPQPEISNRRLKIKKRLKWVDEASPIERSLPLPIITLEASALSSWTSVLTGTKRTWVTGALFEQFLTDSSLEEEVSRDQEEKDTLSPKKRVQLFRNSASSLARKLAGLLAAAPIPISFPVIRQVQNTMLQEASQVHVAEVFLGGLLEEVYRGETHRDPDRIQYDFITGVRDELINTVSVPDAHQVLREISRFVRDRYGQPRDFLASIAAPHEEPDPGTSITNGSHPFAQIELSALRRFGGAFIPFVDELEQYIKLMNERRNELYEDIHPYQTVLEAPQEYSAVLANPVSSDPSFMSKQWCGFVWTAWLPLNSPELLTGPGIYRIRAVQGNEIFYIGLTRRNLKERIGDLYRNIVKDATLMPFNDPHTAAPALWAWKDATGIGFECSMLPLSSQESLEVLVHYFQWHYRLEKGNSTLANHGRFHPDYTKSGNRSTGRRGHRLPEGSSNPAGGPGLEPLRLEGTPLDKFWMGLTWSQPYPLTSSDLKNIDPSPAVYKVMDMDAGELLFVGSTPNLQNRLQNLKQKNWGCPHPVVAFVLQPPHIFSYQLAELENDLLGGYYEQAKEAPKAQFGTPQFDIATDNASETDEVKTSQSPQVIPHNFENKAVQIPPGSHLCQLYSKVTEIPDVTAKLLHEGLLASEKCLFVAAPEQVNALYERLTKAQLDVSAFIASEQLVLSDEKKYLLADEKRFDPYFLLSSHLTFIRQALHEGWKGVRISFDMTWLSKDIATFEQILKYEALADAVFTFQSTPIIALILYDQSKLMPQLVVEMLTLHPISVAEKQIKRNPHYLDFEQYKQKVLRIA